MCHSYAVLASSGINIFKQFEVSSSINSSYSTLFGGALLGAYSARDSILDFYSWGVPRLVRRLGVDVANVLSFV